jgi:xanthine/uracil/vitamin C permease (AzgA family)
MAEMAGMTNKKGQFEGQYGAFFVDAIATFVGSFCGTSPVTTYIESGPGIIEGGRTGLTAITVSFCFFLSIFFAPILSSIPPWCTGFALVLTGAAMMGQVTKVNWDDPCESIPAFVLMIIMPLTYNIGYGLFAGIFTYCVIGGLNLLVEIIVNPEETNAKCKEAIEEYVATATEGMPCFPGFWEPFKPDPKEERKSMISDLYGNQNKEKEEDDNKENPTLEDEKDNAGL